MLTVFTTKTCAYCAMVKRFFDSRQLAYQTVDLEDYPEERQRLFNATGAMTVPIVENNGSYVVGWQPAKLMELVKGND